jgi:hypothetical protein
MKTSRISKSINHTKKNRSIPIKGLPIKGKMIEKRAGWIIIEIYGEAYERGYTHGSLLSNELQNVLKKFPFIVKKGLEISFKEYMRASNKEIKPVIMNKYPEFYEELRGISDGARKNGVIISVDILIGWNAILSMYSYFENFEQYRCSAFIATGKATEKNDIVMAHNTHCDFVTGQLFNIVIYLKPSAGISFVMQTAPGYIASGTDWFVCSNGMIGCETTMSVNYKPVFGTPYFCRVRQAMQYGKDLDDYAKIMLDDNAGDYACSWMFGDTRTNEIMLCEIALKTNNIQRTKNGVFYGMNSPIDFKLRETETDDDDFYDIETSSGSRNIRLDALLNDKYMGKINIENAKKVLSDHYDVILNRNIMNTNAICKHSEINDENSNNYQKFYPFGCTDGKVVNSEMVRNMEFVARFGSACGRDFNVKKYIKDHPEYKGWKNYLSDMPTRDWIKINNR